MKKIILIGMSVDEDSGEVEQNFYLEVTGLQKQGVDVFASDLAIFGAAEEAKAISAGVKKNQIKKHHHKK